MKKIFLIGFILCAFNSFGQTTTSSSKIEARDSLCINKFWITGIQTDTGRFSFADPKKVPTSKAVYDWVRARIAELGAGAITPPNINGQYLNGYNHWSGLNTDSIFTEGSNNLWFTLSRTRNALSANTSTWLNYNSSTGQFSFDTTKGHSLNYLYGIFQTIGGAGVPPLNSVMHVDSSTTTGMLIQGALLRATNGGGSLWFGYKSGSGFDPGDGNTGINVIGFGPAAGVNNSGNGNFFAGYQTGKDNSGYFSNGIGGGTLVGNTANNVNAFGQNAGVSNIYHDVSLFGNGANADSSFQAAFSDGSHTARLNFGWLTANRKYTMPDASGRFVLGIASYLPDRFGIVNLPIFDGTNYYTKFQVDSIASTLSGSGGFPAGIGMNTSDGNMNLGGDLGDNDIDIRSSSTGLGLEINQSTKYLKLGNIHSAQFGIFGDDGYLDASGFNQMLLPNMITSQGINYTMPSTDRAGFLHYDGAGNTEWQDPLPTSGFGILTRAFDGTTSWAFTVFPAPSNTVKQYLNGYNQFVNTNTDSTSEGSSNLYYRDSRARNALSLTTTGAGAASYTSATGVFNIPTSVVQTLTTTGTSGSATLSGGVLNIPQYAGGGSGETNTASNIGGGLGIYNSKVGVDFQFKSFFASDFDTASNLLKIDYANGQSASGSNKGFLSSTDWTNFNNKLSSIDTSNISNFHTKVKSVFAATTPLTYSNGTFGITQSTTSTNGYLSSTDWNTFNNKVSISKLTDSLNALRAALAAARDTINTVRETGTYLDTISGKVYLKNDTSVVSTKFHADSIAAAKIDKAGGTVTTFLGFTKQVSDPATPATGFVDLFFDNSSRLSYKNANGYKRTYSMPYPGDQLWSFPYKITGGTLADSNDVALKLTKNTAITGATKTKITYDANGLVTAGADIAASDLPTGIDAAKLNTGVVSNTEYNYLDGVTSSIQTQVDGKLDKSMSAYKFNANNTNSTANATAQNYKDIGWQTYAGTITWTGTTAPSGTTNHTYRWHQIGGHVWYEIILDYATASSACTAVTFDLPSDMPAPFAPTASLTGAGIFVGNGKGSIYATKTTSPSTNIGGLRQNAAATGSEFNYATSSGSYKMVMVTGDYYIN